MNTNFISHIRKRRYIYESGLYKRNTKMIIRTRHNSFPGLEWYKYKTWMIFSVKARPDPTKVMNRIYQITPNLGHLIDNKFKDKSDNIR